MKGLILMVGLFFVVLSVPVLCEATPISVENPGFENPTLDTWQYGIPGWERSDVAGVLNSSSYPLYPGIPERNNVGFVISGSISQALDYHLIADTTLTLNVDVGWRKDYDLPTYKVELWTAGGDNGLFDNLLASEASATLVRGEFVTSLLSYDVTDLNPYIGEQLQIVLSKTGGTQVNFDEVRLTNDASSAVPEPATMFLLGSGLLGLGRFVRKKRG